MTTDKTVAYYRTLPFTRVSQAVTEDDGEHYFIAQIKEIPWINIDGDTREEAFSRLDEIFDDAIQAMLDAGDEIPEPLHWPMSVGYEPRPGPLFVTGKTEINTPKDLPPFTMLVGGAAKLAPV